MNGKFSPLLSLGLLLAPLPAFNVGVARSAAVVKLADTTSSRHAPIVTIDGGRVRGVAGSGGYAFRGLPYAASPTGSLRWRPPQPPDEWRGVRDASVYAPSCPQPGGFTMGPQDEDCLYLNVSTPRLGDHHGERRPVLVWIHGGGFTSGAGRDYDPAKLAADGIVVVTINYRLGALGFLSHPALASWPGGPSGNYGLMDQQAALRWVQRNIERFGGDPYNVTIAGESAGGVAVLAHLVSRSSRGLFQRAIVQSGSFALTQQSLGAAEAGGRAFAHTAGCRNQTAKCLRNLPEPLTDESYRRVIAGVLGVTDARASAIAAEYPIYDYTSPTLAFSALVGDANFACAALQIDAWTSRRVPTFAYEFNDDAVPWRFVPIDPPVATHLSELTYLFDLPDALFQGPLNTEQEALAASMRTAWATFAASGDPSSTDVSWPSFDGVTVMSLAPPQPQVVTDFASRHHCSFWAAR